MPSNGFLGPSACSFLLALTAIRLDELGHDLFAAPRNQQGPKYRKDDQKEVLDLAIKFLKRHLEKYILDAYDRCTREDMARVWEAQIMLEACPVCGSSSLERRLVVMKKQKLRGWTCTDCGNDVIIPSDVLEMVRNGKLLNEEKT